ncbi:DNA repair protein RadA [Entomobacter blattae]|uniref:DNA repair protein RadA n=1 Tax=Entomobacter blattae TaxID=2762277 RepID=A0A7H1NNT8_9PROT|nr:DNA repair protein RadA [Entomobacter blattae]QNT77448.1 DNA repair protein RadA [Entomobacter blattae]
MAKKPSLHYVCQTCGAVYAKWQGHCEACGEWNTIQEEQVILSVGGAKGNVKGNKLVFSDLLGEEAPLLRLKTGIEEFDRVLGGGLVPSSAVLLGGDPGIGKSTLLLQAACAVAENKKRVFYISGEESIDQIRLRARRLGLREAPLELAATIRVADIVATLGSEKGIGVVIIDSIQTMWMDTVESAPGTVTQVRSSAFELIRIAKQRGFALLFVGHVTKEGALAGPRVLEHMVDAVLYFEGDRGHQFRILRAAKNRFGATDEIGVFTMTDKGLEEVKNPSALFLAERRGNIAGSAVFAGIEGTRPVLLEVQALLSARSTEGNPRRSVVGWDNARLNMLLAVLESRCGLKLGQADVYLNIAGGLRVSEPAADLAVAAAIVSAAARKPVAANTVFFGEIGLSGEVRQVSQPALRLREAAKLGFEKGVLPRRIAPARHAKFSSPTGMMLEEIGHIKDLVQQFSATLREEIE